MSLGKGDPVAPPPGKDEYAVVCHTRQAAVGWKELCNQAPGNTSDAWWQMRTDPAPVPDTPRHHQLKGSLAYGVRNGETLPQWQIEVTSGGRIWYLFDAVRRTCWLKEVHIGHPKATE